MAPLMMKVNVQQSWWVKPLMIASGILMRIGVMSPNNPAVFKFSAKYGVKIDIKEIEEKPKEKYLIQSIHNDGDGGTLRGNLFISWTDGVETAFDAHEWTWDDWDKWQRDMIARKPIDRVGHVMGKPLSRDEFEDWEINDRMKREERL